MLISILVSVFETNRNSYSCVFQFLTLKSEDERQQLIPVIHTMLKLSKDEKELLLSVARGKYQHF